MTAWPQLSTGLADAALLAERLGIGLMLEAPSRALNAVMAELSARFGLDSFLTPGRIALSGGDGRTRRFSVTRVHLADALVLAVTPLGRSTPLPTGGLHPFLRLDTKGRIEFANEAGREFIDYAGAPAIEARLRASVPEALARGESAVDVALGPRVFSFVLASVNGSALHAYGREVSEHRFIEASLRRNEARLRALIEAAPDGILISTTLGRIEFVNPQAEAMFGYGRGELLGRSIETFIPEWFASPPIVRLMAGDETAAQPVGGQEPLSGCRHDGPWFPLEVSSSPLVQNGGRYIASIVRDVTERERAATRIRELNENLARNVERLTTLNQELEAFSYSVSHDLRAPLRSIDGFSAILADDYAALLDAQGQDFLARIRAATGRMSDLIDGLLRLSRITRAELMRENVDISEMAVFIAQNLRQADAGRDVEFTIAPHMRAYADRALLTVLLENLLGNAWKFTANRSPARIEFGCEEQRGRKVYFVRDNGTGFDMRYLGKLFRPFERLHGRDYPGTGIGLATVQRIVQRHGGEVWAESGEGEGATFSFTLGEIS